MTSMYGNMGMGQTNRPTGMQQNSGFQGPAGNNLRGNAAGNFSKDKIPKGYELGQLQQFTPEQMQLFQQLFSHLGPDSFLSQIAGGDQSGFEEMEAPAMRQFEGLIGQNASRFSGQGMGSRRGSAFQNSTNQITSDFAQDLASRRQSFQRQAIQDLMGYSNQLLGQRPQEKFLKEKPQSFGQQIFGSLMGGLGQGLGSLSGLLF
jgi:hypothetical protein